MLSQRSELSEEIIKWAATRSDDAVMNPKEGYYHFNIVAEAYEKGFEDREKKLKEHIRGIYFEHAKVAGEAIGEILKKLKKYTLNNAFVRVDTVSAGLLISVDEKDYISQDFFRIAYGFVSDLKAKYFDKGWNLEIGFINHDNLVDHDDLQCDGYAMAVNLKTAERIY